MKKLLPLLLICFSGTLIYGQAFVTRDIRSFGAKGDGRTNDHAAFLRATEFFNARGGNGRLVIPKGTYIVGRQTSNVNVKNRAVYEGSTVLELRKVKNLVVEGQNGAVLRYTKGLRFGAFDPTTGKPHEHGNNYFVNEAYKAWIGAAVSFLDCQNVQLKNLELDGNSDGLILGGVYGDVGIQIVHIGIFVQNSTNVLVDNVNTHHFGLDGIQVSNNTGNKKEQDKIVLQNSRFEYNGRQGLSWVGGNDLTATNCKFNHTGRGKIATAPGAGVDIEAEAGPLKNGKFVRCEFINNTGNGLVADTGPSSDCVFTDCLFWGTTSWSAWVNKPNFTFINSTFHGSFVHGFDAATDAEATRFIGCRFEDKPYNGKEVFGYYLIETNYRRRMLFENCTMVANKKKLVWMDSAHNLKPEEKYQLINCHFLFLGGQPPGENFVAVMRSVLVKNCTFEIRNPKAAGWYFAGLGDAYNVNKGGNKMVTNGAESKL